jgi:hypothetical protein
MLAVVLFIASMAGSAQGQPRGPRSGSAPDSPRGIIQVTNDWRDEVKLSLWSHKRERIGEWVLRPGENAALDVDGTRIKVRPSYKIKVGDDWGWVDVGEVGQFQQGIWYVNVRNVWTATHRDRPGVPDWKR